MKLEPSRQPRFSDATALTAKNADQFALFDIEAGLSVCLPFVKSAAAESVSFVLFRSFGFPEWDDVTHVG